MERRTNVLVFKGWAQQLLIPIEPIGIEHLMCAHFIYTLSYSSPQPSEVYVFLAHFEDKFLSKAGKRVGWG